MKKLYSLLMSVALFTVLLTGCANGENPEGTAFDYTGDSFLKALQEQGLVTQENIPQITSENQDATLYYVAKVGGYNTVQMSYEVKNDGKVGNAVLIGKRGSEAKLSDEMAETAVKLVKVVDNNLGEREITTMLDELGTAAEQRYKEKEINGVQYRIYIDDTMVTLYINKGSANQ